MLALNRGARVLRIPSRLSIRVLLTHLFLQFLMCYLLYVNVSMHINCSYHASARPRLSVCPSVCYQTCEHDILKPNDFDASWHKWSTEHGHLTVRLGGQRSRSHEAEDRFRGLAEASFSTPLNRVASLVYIAARCCA